MLQKIVEETENLKPDVAPDLASNVIAFPGARPDAAIQAAISARLDAAAETGEHVPKSELLWIACHAWKEWRMSRSWPDEATYVRDLEEHTALMRKAMEAQAAEALERGDDPLYKGDNYSEWSNKDEAPKGKQKREKVKYDPAPDAPDPETQLENFVAVIGKDRLYPSRLFTYRNADGTVHSVIARWDNFKGDKAVRPYFWGSHDRVAPHWVMKRHPRPILYRLPEVIAGVLAGKKIVILEGEKDVHGAIDRGYEKDGNYVFTTTPGGALNNGKGWHAWDDVDYSPLAGANVTLVPDPGEAGRAWGEGIGNILTTMNGATAPAKVRVGTIPDNWSNGHGKAWGFGDKSPVNATDADIEKVLTDTVPFEDWKAQNKTQSKTSAQEVVNWPDTGRAAGDYEESILGIDYVTYDQKGKAKRTPIANFAARIIERITFDDGAEVQHRFKIQAFLNGRYYSFMIGATEFPRVDLWSLREIGANAIIEVGKISDAGKKDHLRQAIQQFSPSLVPQRTIYAHTGWREIRGQQVYLHAGGGIGAAGAVPGIETDLGPWLGSTMLLPDPPEGEALKVAIRSSLDLLDLGPHHIIAPQYAAVWRATLRGANFSVFPYGKSGGFKTEMQVLMLRHWGAGFAVAGLPNWHDTGNSLEARAYVAKDMLFPVDDFAPAGSPADVSRMHREAARFLRAQGNLSARGRLRSDATQRPSKAPRGLTLSNGEDLPRTESIGARCFVVEVHKGDVTPEALTLAQEAGERGDYALAMSSWLRHLAATPAAWEAFQAARKEYRSEMRGDHARTGWIAADLLASVKVFLAFAVSARAIDEAERDVYLEDCRQGILHGVGEQSEHIRQQDDAVRFIQLIGAALVTHRAHLASDKDGTSVPSEMQEPVWGWSREKTHTGFSILKPGGELIGWTNEVDGVVWLEPTAAYGLAQKMTGPEGNSLSVGKETLWKRLADAGKIARSTTGKNLHRKAIGGRGNLRWLLCLPADILKG